MARKGKERGMGCGKGTSRKEKGGRGRKRGDRERRGRKGRAMSPSENSLKIYWLQMRQNPFSAGALPLRELATLPQPPRRLRRFPLPISFLSRGFWRLDLVSAPRASRFLGIWAYVVMEGGPNDFLAGGPKFEVTPLEGGGLKMWKL